MRLWISLLCCVPMLHTWSAMHVVNSEFIYEKAPFPQCHASTICDSAGTLIAAWFGGSREGAKDVEIWTSRQVNGRWTAPVSVANGLTEKGREPTWNPVLFQHGKALHLFYKVGPSPSQWWGMRITSSDNGQTWSKPERLPDGILGPIKNKPVLLADGAILCGSSTEHDGWRVHFERFFPDANRWEKSALVDDPKQYSAIQPTILIHSNTTLQALCRAKKGNIVETWSRDAGRTWSPLAPTELPNPNSGIDAVTLKNGHHLLVYNPVKKGRSPLAVAESADGKTWRELAALEKDPGEYSYPAIIQAADNSVHITYTWKRQKVKHVTMKE